MDRQFRIVETFFSDKIYEIIPKRYIENINICCEEDQIEILVLFAEELKRYFSQMTDKDICIALIYTFYALSLLEYNEQKFLRPTIYESYADNPRAVNDLYLAITTGNLSVQRPGAQLEDILSVIRRYMLQGEGSILGGKKRRRTRRTRTTRTTRTRRTRTIKRRTRK